MVKLQETKGRYFITFPKNIVESKQWEKGQDLIIGFNQDGDIIIKSYQTKKKKEVIKDVF